MTIVTFIIPVRHQDNARDWGLLKKRLSETVRSVANQTNGGWRGIVVANEGADLPELPEKFSIARVGFPPNDLHELGKGSKEDFLDAFRADKGRRVLSGMLEARDSLFFMIVDDDDLVSSHITQFVSENRDSNGWTISRGYLWNDGGGILFAYDDFNHKCGTSLIVRGKLYNLPMRFEDVSIEWIKEMLGSHHKIDKILAQKGMPLDKLPFRGAVYRVANAGSHSQVPGITAQFFLGRQALKRPIRGIANLGRLRIITNRSRREFFGFR